MWEQNIYTGLVLLYTNHPPFVIRQSENGSPKVKGMCVDPDPKESLLEGQRIVTVERMRIVADP